MARKGLEIGPTSEHAALGHYVLADLYNRRGGRAKPPYRSRWGEALEARTTKRRRRFRGSPGLRIRSSYERRAGEARGSPGPSFQFCLRR